MAAMDPIGVARAAATYQHQPVQPYRPYETVTSFDPALYGQLVNSMTALGLTQGDTGPVDTRSVSRTQRANAALGVGAAGGGGSNDALIRRLLLQYSRAQTQANAANISRYNQINRGYDRRTRDALATLTGMGAQSRADILQRGFQAKAARGQDLVARGLTGTTIKPAVERGIDQDVEAQLARLDEGLRRERVGYQTQLTGDQLSFQERRTDQAPDLNQMIGLLSALGVS